MLPDNYIMIRKEIKHARIKVHESGHVYLYIPTSFTEDDLQKLLVKKRGWIEKQLNFFNKKERIELGRNQLLLWGNRYDYYYDDTFKRKVIVNYSHKTIRANRDLTDPEEQIRWYRREAKNYLIPRTKELADRLNLDFNELYIRSQKTKLGNCTYEGNISLNWRLIKAPKIVIDYIIVHELVHTLVMKHTNKFWTLLKSYFPDYKYAISWLEKYGNSL